MRLVPLALSVALALAVQCALASSTTASSASDAGSSASGSLSDSLKGSSNSSGGERRAEGRYRVTEVAQADAAGKLRLKLEREGAAPVELTLPRQALATRAVSVGDEVQATPQPYGIAFAHADTGQAFFLVLEDNWHRELPARVVKP